MAEAGSERTPDRVPSRETSKEQKAEAAKEAAGKKLGGFSENANVDVRSQAERLATKMESVPAGDPSIKRTSEILSWLEGKNRTVATQERVAMAQLLSGDLPMKA